jgi:glycosyltransferase involved in cell wall biosynthesis
MKPEENGRTEPCDVSVVVPVYDEQDNLETLVQRIRTCLDGASNWELILVDDGSRDRSAQIIERLSSEDSHIRGLYFEANCGQTSATAAGLRNARGALIATLDADLQNDPSEIPRMIGLMGEHDAVVGYRSKRRDGWVRRASSRIANSVRNRVSGDSIRDTGCSLKVFRSEAVLSLPLFEGMHRFLPTLLRYHGYSVLEVPVSHYPRFAGKSKYGIRNRLLRSFKDLLAVRWMRSRLIRYRLRQESQVL